MAYFDDYSFCLKTSSVRHPKLPFFRLLFSYEKLFFKPQKKSIIFLFWSHCDNGNILWFLFFRRVFFFNHSQPIFVCFIFYYYSCFLIFLYLLLSYMLCFTCLNMKDPVSCPLVYSQNKHQPYVLKMCMLLLYHFKHKYPQCKI